MRARDMKCLDSMTGPSSSLIEKSSRCHPVSIKIISTDEPKLLMPRLRVLSSSQENQNTLPVVTMDTELKERRDCGRIS
ncbi:hypothetical protein E4U54_001831 [Claviceps lovelessii]|nr:hypothetical protein E4U54_001831 [Claviceps lovelessii]